MQSETGFPSSHQLKSYVAYKCRLKLAARAVLSADAGLLVYSNCKRTLRVDGDESDSQSHIRRAQHHYFSSHQYFNTTIKIVRLSVTVGDRGKRRAARGWLGVLGVVDPCFGVSQPASRR